MLGSESQIVTTRTRQVIDFQMGQANAALLEYEQLEFGIQYDFDISDFFGVFADAWGAAIWVISRLGGSTIRWSEVSPSSASQMRKRSVATAIPTGRARSTSLGNR